jgi:hypothetical protein
MENKPKLVILRDPAEIAALLAIEGNLDAPVLFKGMCADGPQYAADADQLRAWRAGSANTSQGDK